MGVFGATLALAGVATPAQAAASRSLSLAVTPAAVATGQTLSFAGTLTTSPKGSTVQLQRYSSGKWATIGTTWTTSARGGYAWSTKATGYGSTSFRAVAAATRSLRAAFSASDTIGIYRWAAVTLTASSTAPKVGTAVTFTGTAKPFATGQKVTLQRATATGNAWSTVANGTVSKSGTFTLADTPTAGTWRYRAQVARSTSAWIASSLSPAVTVTPVSPAPAVDWKQISAGSVHTCGVKIDGTLWCWGDNHFGEVGNGTSSTGGVTTPSQVGTDTDWASVTTGDKFTCAIRTTGTLWCWGRYFATTGMGAPPTTSPKQVGTATTWATVSAGESHVCATTTAGTLWCWGLDFQGQLGIGGGMFDLQTDPTQVGTATTWSSVSTGTFHTCATRTDHTLWCWGDNASGELGIGSTTSSTTPQQVAGTTWASVAASGLHTCATRTNRSLWCWGENGSGELGLGSTTDQTAPQQVAAATLWTSVTAGGSHTCAISLAGGLWCWGADGSGQLGNGGTTASSSPVRISAVGWASVDGGDSHTCGIKTDGTAWCWGENAAGQLGNGTTTNAGSPMQIP